MSQQEITPEVFTADYTGAAGKREFFIQGRTSSEAHTFSLEKQQVALLAEKLSELLLLVDEDDTVVAAQPARDPALQATPDEPSWRVGAIGLAYEETGDEVAVLVEPVRDSDEEDIEDIIASDDAVRFMLRRDQVRSFILHAVAVIAEGRPLCQLCGLPMDPGGHACPASNGHHPQV
jgi:uncharacterized repeat protein (TIGR03847 family)